jgi:hypothetical protein
MGIPQSCLQQHIQAINSLIAPQQQQQQWRGMQNQQQMHTFITMLQWMHLPLGLLTLEQRHHLHLQQQL